MTYCTGAHRDLSITLVNIATALGRRMHVELKVVYAPSLAVTGTATAIRPQVSDACAKHWWHVPDRPLCSVAGTSRAGCGGHDLRFHRFIRGPARAAKSHAGHCADRGGWGNAADRRWTSSRSGLAQFNSDARLGLACFIFRFLRQLKLDRDF